MPKTVNSITTQVEWICRRQSTAQQSKLNGQWRNVISGAPRFKIFEGPPSRSAKGTSWAPYMHEFSRGSRACSSGKCLNLYSLKCHFLDLGERFYRIRMVRKRHCNISEALAVMFLLYRLNLGAPIWPIEAGGPRVLPVWAHSSYATVNGYAEDSQRHKHST
jgi:hypothetical protein